MSTFSVFGVCIVNVFANFLQLGLGGKGRGATKEEMNDMNESSTTSTSVITGRTKLNINTVLNRPIVLKC